MSSLVARSVHRASACAVAVILLLSLPASGQRAAPPAAAAPPRLVVLIVVDQMRADYVDRYHGDWTSGLKRLLTRGARFTNAAYPYLETYTCAGHATIATGAFPHVHGIMQNTWFDRERGEVIPCTDDRRAKAVSYSGTGDDGFGPGRLRIPTLADEMRAQRGSQIVTLSLKARSAIMMAGHDTGAVTWMSERLDGWQTSTAYSEQPVPAVKQYVDTHSIDADYGAVWQRLLPTRRYPEPDADDTEAPPAGWTSAFPHPMTAKDGGPGREYRDLWQHSPYGDQYLGRMAAALTERMRLGRPQTTDMLAVSFSSPDLVGHQFGPGSQEVRDVYARLDRVLGQLFARLDTLIGRDQYVVGLSSDHGVGEIPEQLMRRGISGGRLRAASIRDVAEAAAASALGRGTYVARVHSNDVYFLPGVYARLQQQPGALDAVVRAIAQQTGIERVFRREEIAGQAGSGDRLVRAAALSYVPDRSGDLVLATKPGWMFSVNGTTHGSANPDDQRVPLLFMGRDIMPGTYSDAATPADLAPTLAAVAGIALPRADGRALTAALRTARAATK